jgi:membrane protein
MTFANRAITVAKRSNKRAWLAGLALVGTYVLARTLDSVEPARQTERPAAAKQASTTTSWAFWKDVLYRTYTGMNDDRLLAVAGGVVFFGLLALFPAITAVVSSYALFADPATISEHLAKLQDMMPQSAYGIVNEQVTRIVSRTGGVGIALFIGLALAIWSANAGIKAVIDALNVIYGVKERRSFIRLNLISLTFTIGTIIGLLLAIGAIVVLPIMFAYLPLGTSGGAVMAWLRWPALLVLLVLGLEVLYRFGPDRDHPRWQWISVGTVFAAVAWLIGSAALSWYLSNFADYNATYGSLGAAIGLMMWLWMTAIVVLLGAELNTEIEAAKREQVRSSAH